MMNRGVRIRNWSPRDLTDGKVEPNLQRRTADMLGKWWARLDSNQQPADYESDALTD